MGKYDVLVCGNASVDVIFSEIEQPPKPGEEIYCEDFEFTCGASYNTAVALSRLGIKVAMAGTIGNDFLSRFILENLEAEGVATEYMKRFDRPLQTLSVALNYNGDRSFVSYEDKVIDFNREKYRNEVIQKVDTKVLHISADEMAESTIHTAKEKGITISLDVGWDKNWLKHPKLKEIIKMGDIFTPNLKEAIEITGDDDPAKALELLSDLNPNNIIIVKLGEEGAIFKNQNKVVKVPGMKRNVVDTTGAGDVFVAGILAGILKKFELKEAVRLGNFCGGCSVEGLGGTKTSPYWNDVLDKFYKTQNGGII